MYVSDIPVIAVCEPIEYFRNIFTDDLFDIYVEQSNLYSVQKNPNKLLNVNPNELEQWLGLCIHFSISKLPNVIMHWSNSLGILNGGVSEIMSRNRWEDIKSNLHMVDNSTLNCNDNTDKLFKIRLVRFLAKINVVL